MEKIQLIEEQRQREERQRLDAQSQARVARFMEAIKHRRHHFADFDQVVIRGNTPATPEMLGLMAESPYAADIAYYLGKHPEESKAITLMAPAEAASAVRHLAATIAAENADRK